MTDASLADAALLKYFDDLKDASEAERDDVLAKISTDNNELAGELRDLLLAGDKIRDKTLAPVQLMEPAGEILAGQVVGDYEVRRTIGRGGMGVVYEASRVDGRTDQRVALKIVHGLIGQDSQYVQRFLRERRLLSRLVHPNIATLIDARELPDGRPYMVMELVQGVEATSFLSDSETGTSRTVRALGIVIQLCAAVELAHKRLVVHRDIKPSNVLVTEDGSVKLIDFGISKALEDDSPALTRRDDPLLTLSYAAPEQAKGQHLDVGCDIYSIGMLAFELVAGRGPFDWASMSYPERLDAVINRDPPPCSAVARVCSGAQVGSDLDAILAKALAKESGRRYASVAGFREDLENYLCDRPVSARPISHRYRATKFLRRHRVPVAVVGTAGVVVAAALGLFIAQLAESRRQEAIAAREAQKGLEVAGFLVDSLRAVNPSAGLGPDVSLKSFLYQTLRTLDGQLDDQSDVKAALYVTIGEVLKSLSDYAELDEIIKAHDGFVRESLESDPNYLARWALVVAGAHSYDDENAEALQIIGEGFDERLDPDIDTQLEIAYVDALSRVERLDEARDRADRLLARLDGQDRLTTKRYVEAAFVRARIAYFSEEAGTRTRVLVAAKERVDRYLRADDPLNMQVRVAMVRSDLDPQVKLQLAKEAQDLAQDIYGQESLAFIGATNALGTAYKSMNDIDNAIISYRRVESSVIAMNGLNHGSVARVRFNMAITLAEAGRLAPSYPVFRECLEVAKSVWHEDHFNLHLFQVVFGIYLNQGGEFAESAAVLADAHRIAQDESFHTYDAYVEGELAYAVALYGDQAEERFKTMAQDWVDRSHSLSLEARQRVLDQIEVANRIGMSLTRPEWATSTGKT